MVKKFCNHCCKNKQVEKILIKGEVKMNVLLDMINGVKTTIELKDLNIFFKMEEVDSNYRSEILNLSQRLELVKQEFEVTQENAHWTLVSTSTGSGLEGLFLYNENEKIMFVNYSFIGSMFFNGVKRKLNKRGFFLFGGVYNNSHIEMIDGIQMLPATDLASFMYEKIYGEFVQSYNDANIEQLIERAAFEFEKADEIEQQQITNQAEDDAICYFIHDELPKPVQFALNYEVYFLTDKLRLDGLEEMFEVLNQKDEYLSRLAANPILNESVIKNRYRHHLAKLHYEANVEKWNQDNHLLGARKIANLRKSGALVSTKTEASAHLTFDIVLKDNKKKQQVFCSQPSKQDVFFNTSSHSRVHYQDISEIWVDGKKVYSFNDVKDEETMTDVLNKAIQELKSEETPKPKKKSLLIEAKENISQKKTLVKGQLALPLW